MYLDILRTKREGSHSYLGSLGPFDAHLALRAHLAALALEAHVALGALVTLLALAALLALREERKEERSEGGISIMFFLLHFISRATKLFWALTLSNRILIISFQ